MPTLRGEGRAPGLRCEARPIGRDRQLSPDNRTDPVLFRGAVESRRTVHTIGIDQRERWIAERGGTLDQRFGKRRAAQETERGSGVEFYVHVNNPITPNAQRLSLPQLPRCSRMNERLGIGRASDVGSWELSSINDPLEEPMVRVALTNQAIRRAIVERHVPFVTIPLGIGGWTRVFQSALSSPPRARCPPRPGALFHPPSTQPPPVSRQPRWLALFDVHTRGNREAETSKRNDRGHGLACFHTLRH